MGHFELATAWPWIDDSSHVYIIERHWLLIFCEFISVASQGSERFC
jgi:hypothetical protein